ncbi:hypothetical protein I79_002894 [Cricetulus griseus]|uniref:Uncharacterized protein n=1 Tax=Cricetulus griseus TaxID=10029 RepID=G3GYL4_CRIGR|nr:hypothetical protein I79_002894 [Cricetulus griseus]
MVTNCAVLLAQRQGSLYPAAHLPLIPVGRLVHRDHRLNGCQLICIGLHTDPRVEAQGQQVVDNLGREEAGSSCRMWSG